LSHELTDCGKYQTKGKRYYTENVVISELEFLIDSVCIEFEWHVFQQIIGIPLPLFPAGIHFVF